jgi:hypothetical protein
VLGTVTRLQVIQVHFDQPSHFTKYATL